MTILATLTALCLIPPANGSDSLRVLWNQARPYTEFLARVNEREEQWRRSDSIAAVPDRLAVRARRTGRLRLLVVTVYACSDSTSVVPYLARLAALAPNLELRIAHPDQGRWLMEAHRTPDGRAATPTLVVLDEDFNERGCWLERPAELQRWYIATGRDLPQDEYLRHKMSWYAADSGLSTLEEVVTVLEAAASGHRICG